MHTARHDIEGMLAEMAEDTVFENTSPAPAGTCLKADLSRRWPRTTLTGRPSVYARRGGPPHAGQPMEAFEPSQTPLHPPEPTRVLAGVDVRPSDARDDVPRYGTWRLEREAQAFSAWSSLGRRQG
jgi:hypothetical protein